MIDDRRDACYTLQRILELSGHEVHVAADGPHGIELACAVRPDLVLCDIGLSGEMSGYDVVRKLRHLPETAHAHVVAVTGYGQDEVPTTCRGGGIPPAPGETCLGGGAERDYRRASLQHGRARAGGRKCQKVTGRVADFSPGDVLAAACPFPRCLAPDAHPGLLPANSAVGRALPQAPLAAELRSDVWDSCRPSRPWHGPCSKSLH